MDLNDIKELFLVLKENGDKVLDGSNKLTLSIDLLQYLVESFNLIIEQREDVNTTFEVINTFNSKVEIFRDLQFLHDFVQKTIGLKICARSKNEKNDGAADVSKFRSLKLLELNRVPIDDVTGIRNLRSQLHCLICTRCLNDLGEILVGCGGDRSSGFMWSELKEAIFSHNDIRSIDKDALEFTPWLQILDLSHNNIKDARAIHCLPNLKHLNLSYNKLEQIPVFSPEQTRMMQILILKNNYIEDLTGLVALSSLCELDVSFNCLIDHSALSALPMLATLQWLCLDGNPISFHPHHRTLTARYLHSNTASVKFVLDDALLSKRELVQVGTYHTNCIRLAEQFAGKRDHLSSISSSIASSATLTSDTVNISNASDTYNRQSGRRSGRVRRAVISEHDDDGGEIANGEMNKSCASVSSLEASVDHLETKRQIEDLREKFGETWLHNRGGALFQDVLGLEKTPAPTFTSTPQKDDATCYKSVLHDDSFGSPSPQSNRTLVFDDSSNSLVSPARTADTTYRSVVESTASEDNFYDNKTEDGENGDSMSAIDTSDEDELEHEDEQLFIVQSEQTGGGGGEQLFLCISLRGDAIRERNAGTAKTQTRWPLSTLLSCERTSRGVHMSFDTVRRDRHSRYYTVDDDDEAQNLVRLLERVLSSRSLSELNQKIYRCMKCSTQFSQETDERVLMKATDNRNVLVCPTCGSTLVIEQEDDASAMPAKALVSTRDLSPPEAAECALPPSPSHSSIGSADSLEESTGSQNSTTDSQQKKGDSDIEVLSNPSQDSIEVLSVLARGASLTPRRKRSSEERKVFVVPPPPIPIVETSTPIVTALTSIPVGLTESSSSDSLTDSICTAYENRSDVHTKRVVLNENTEMKISAPRIVKDDDAADDDKKKKTVENKKSDANKKTNVDKEIDGKRVRDENKMADVKGTNDDKTLAGSVGTLSSMLEGFLQSASKIITPPANVPIAKRPAAELNVEFSYVDFTQVDHRVKLHLYLNVFEDEQEELVWLLRTKVLAHNAAAPYGGCLVLSTRKVYLMRIDDGPMCDETQRWLHKAESFTVDRLRTVFALPWKQGVGLEIAQAGAIASGPIYVLCFLQDLLRTSNFLAYLASKNTLPDTCELQCSVSDRTMLNIQQMLLSTASQSDSDPAARMMCVYSRCEIVVDEQPHALSMGSVLISNHDLVLTVGDLTWMRPDAANKPEVFRAQPMSNLIEINCRGKTITLDYLDESAGAEEVWKITLDTSTGVEGIIEAIRKPWENLFSVPLQINFNDET